MAQREMAAITIQKVFRGWRARIYFYEKRKELRKRRLRAIICLQSYVRGWIARHRVSKLKKNLDLERGVEAAIAIQKVVRGFLVRKKVTELRIKLAERKRYDAAVILQKAVRVWLAKKTLSNLKDKDIKRKEKAVVVLQQAVRRWLAGRSQKKAHLEMQRRLAAVTKIQAAYRGWLARKRVKNMKQKRAIVRKKQRTMKEDSILQRLQRQALVTAALEEQMVTERKASFKPNGRMPSHSQSSPDHHQPALGYQLHKEHHQSPSEYSHSSRMSMKGQPRTSSQHYQPTSSHHPSSARSIDQSINVEDGKQWAERPSKRVRRPDVAANDPEVAASDPSHQISHNLMSLALKTSVKARGHGQDLKQSGMDRNSSLNTYKMYSDSLKQFMSNLESQCEYVSLLQQSTAGVSVLPKVAKGRSKSSSSDDRYNSKSGQLVPNPRSPYSPLRQRRVAAPSSPHPKGTTPTSKEHQSQKTHQNKQLILPGQQSTHPHLKTTPPSPHLQRAMHNSQIHIQKTTSNPHPKRTPTSPHPKRTTPPHSKETTPSPHLKESTSSSERQTTPIKHQHQTTPPSPRLHHGELPVVMEPNPRYLTSSVSSEGEVPSRTKSTKLYFERIAEENKKQAEAIVPKRGRSFFGKWKRGGDSKFHPQKQIAEINTGGGISNFQQFFSKFKSKHFVQDSLNYN